MNKKRLFIILAICGILAAAFVLGVTGAIDLSKEKELQPEDRLIGLIVTTEPVWGQPVIKSGNIDFGPNEGVPAEKEENTSSDRSIPAKYDFVFPGVEGVRLFNVDTPPFSDGHTQVDTSAADEEFSRISPGFHMADNTNNGIKTTEKEYSITGTINYVIQDEDVTFFTAPIYQTSEGGIYLGHSGGGYSYRKDQMHFSSGGTFSQSASQSSTKNDETTTEKRTINAKIQIVREPVKITLCQYNAARELIQADEYLPDNMPRKITPLREAVMVVVDTENKADDVSEKHTFQALSMEDTYFYTLQYKGNGYCLENYHELLWPDPAEATDLAWKAENGTLTISGHGNMPDFERHPSWVDKDGYTVMGTVATPWEQADYSRVIIDEGITSIGNLAFDSDDKMTKMTLPESITAIPAHAFKMCEKLTEINIPDSITTIESYTFYGCSSLKKISLPGSITEIRSNAFAHCTVLGEVTLPDSITTVDSCAFEACLNLRHINLPATVQYIDADAFDNCGSLESITVAEGSYAEHYCIENKLPYDYGDGTPVHTPAPDNPSISWKVENDTLFISGTGAMDNYKQRYIAEGSENNQKTYGTNAPWDKEAFSRVVIGEGITSIGELTFSNRCGLYSVTLPKSLTTIGKEAFYSCNDLEDINLEAVKILEEKALMGCHSLKSITLPSTIKEIKNGLFWACISLKEISIPNSVTSIDRDAFFNCFGLEKVFIPSSVTDIKPRIFDGCKNLKEIVVEKGSVAEQYCIDNNLPYTY